MSAEDNQTVCPHCGAVNRIAQGKAPQSAKCGKCHEPLFAGRPLPAPTATFDRFLNRDSVPLVVDFWAEWCGPCRAMAPIFEAAARDLEPEFRFLKVDTEAEPQLAARYQIRAIPTLMVFHKGKMIGHRAGAMDRQSLAAWLRQLPRAA